MVVTCLRSKKLPSSFSVPALGEPVSEQFPRDGEGGCGGGGGCGGRGREGLVLLRGKRIGGERLLRVARRVGFG